MADSQEFTNQDLKGKKENTCHPRLQTASASVVMDIESEWHGNIQDSESLP